MHWILQKLPHPGRWKLCWGSVCSNHLCCTRERERGLGSLGLPVHHSSSESDWLLLWAFLEKHSSVFVVSSGRFHLQLSNLLRFFASVCNQSGAQFPDTAQWIPVCGRAGAVRPQGCFQGKQLYFIVITLQIFCWWRLCWIWTSSSSLSTLNFYTAAHLSSYVAWFSLLSPSNQIVAALKAGGFSPFCSCLNWVKDGAICNTPHWRWYRALLSSTVIGL